MPSNSWFKITHQWTDRKGRDCKVIVNTLAPSVSEAFSKFVHEEVAGDDVLGSITIETTSGESPSDAKDE